MSDVRLRSVVRALPLFDELERLEPTDTGHHHIQHDHVIGHALQMFARRRRIACNGHSVAVVGEVFA